MVLSSEKYKEWHADATWQLRALKNNLPKNPIPSAFVTITFFAPDKRKSDLSNKAESIMDLLVDNGILEDDNWFVCPYLHLMFGGVDSKNPRAIIEIIEIHGK